MFTITRILYIEFFSLYFTITGAGNMVYSIEDFNIIIEVRSIGVLLYKIEISAYIQDFTCEITKLLGQYFERPTNTAISSHSSLLEVFHGRDTCISVPKMLY